MEDIKIVLNEAIITKLEITALDLKHYININAAIGGINGIKYMDDEDLNELMEIRSKLKKLSYKLKNKLND